MMYLTIHGVQMSTFNRHVWWMEEPFKQNSYGYADNGRRREKSAFVFEARNRFMEERFLHSFVKQNIWSNFMADSLKTAFVGGKYKINNVPLENKKSILNRIPEQSYFTVNVFCFQKSFNPTKNRSIYITSTPILWRCTKLTLTGSKHTLTGQVRDNGMVR